MAKTDNLSDFLTDVANSIRTKKGTTGTINAQNFSSEIASIETGSNPYVAANTTEMAQYLASKYDGAIVRYTGTTGTYTQNMLYKVKAVSANEWAFDELLTPVGSTTKTENGTYDVKEYAEVVVNVPSSGSTLKNLLDATKQTSYLFHNYNGTSVDDLIQPNDTENVTDMHHMFYSATNLTTIPLLNTINVTDMRYMFQNCTNLTTIPQLNTSNVTNMYYTFSDCPSLATIPQLNTGNVINMYGMFRNCTSLTTILQLDTSRVENMTAMFYQCTSLTTVPALDVNKVAKMNGMFDGCTNLKSILMTNIGTDLNISASTQFERSDLVTILNNLKIVTSTKTLTMGATNLAKLTDEDKAIATNKGWTLA